MTDLDSERQRKILLSPYGAHETRATLRAHRAGKSAQYIMASFKMSALDLSRSLKDAMDEEQSAFDTGRQIHDALIEIPKEKT